MLRIDVLNCLLQRIVCKPYSSSVICNLEELILQLESVIEDIIYCKQYQVAIEMTLTVDEAMEIEKEEEEKKKQKVKKSVEKVKTSLQHGSKNSDEKV